VAAANLIRQCWQSDAAKRPTFADIQQALLKELDLLDPFQPNQVVLLGSDSEGDGDGHSHTVGSSQST